MVCHATPTFFFTFRLYTLEKSNKTCNKDKIKVIA